MPQYISRAAVLGSGVMGAAIAAQIAGAGISVVLLDMAPGALTEQEQKKGLTLESPVVRNRFSQAGKDRVLSPKARTIYEKDLGNLITVGNFTDDMALLGNVDWIIEVIVERLDAKRDLLEKVQKVRKSGCIVSSNTSGISINTMIETMPLEFRQHFIGTHFFNPPRQMKLVELIPSNDCAPETRAFMRDFMERTLGKAVVLCKDTPGFIANRIGTFVALAGVKTFGRYPFNLSEIDQITGPAVGRPKMGTFRLLDAIGLDIPIFVAQNIADNVTSAEEKDAFSVPEFHKALVSKGFLGDKTKQGYYKKVKTPEGTQSLIWDAKQEDYIPATRGELPAVARALQCKTLDERLCTMLSAQEEDGKLAWEVTKATLLYAAEHADEIAFDYHDIDTAMKYGYNWEYGPFEIWQAIGLKESVARMKAEGAAVPAWIESMAADGAKPLCVRGGSVSQGKPFRQVVKENEDAALYHMGDDVLLLEFKTKANAVEPGVSELMLEAVNTVESGYAGLVLANGGKNFSVGANLTSPTGLSKDLDLKAVEQSIELLQQANMALKYCKRPVIAAPFGSTLGGGAEIVMHTYGAVASAETNMGLVEVGVGLVPAGGGVKELLVRYMGYAERAPKASVIDFVQAAWDLLYTGKVSSSAHEAAKWGFLRPGDSILLGAEYALEQAKKTVLHLSESSFRPLYRRNVMVTGATGRAALEYTSSNLQRGGFLTEYDALIARKLAYIITGGEAPGGSMVSEEHILRLEKETFLELLCQEKTQQRIDYMLKTGKRLGN